MKKIPKLENKKYGEIIIKVPLKSLQGYIKKLKDINIKTFETKIYHTHFVKRILN